MLARLDSFLSAHARSGVKLTTETQRKGYVAYLVRTRFVLAFSLPVIDMSAARVVAPTTVQRQSAVLPTYCCNDRYSFSDCSSENVCCSRAVSRDSCAAYTCYCQNVMLQLHHAVMASSTSDYGSKSSATWSQRLSCQAQPKQ